VISVKYLALVMRADNQGEGGILALTALVMPENMSRTTVTAAVVTLGVFGTALLYGDGLITPAISVLSAVEGFEVATTAFADLVIPVAIVILVALFAIQRRGTAGIARFFGPVMVIWFTTLGVLGLSQIARHPGVLRAVSPSYGLHMFTTEPWRAFLALGSVFLVVTGGEALYADMGHFGRRPISVAWYGLVLPGLLLAYFGQAALLTSEPDAIEGPFYRMAPEWAVPPLAVLATVATVIASQALISGAFSLTAQAVQLDYLPRVKIVHTSAGHRGQVYVPLVNWGLMVGCVALVIGFGSSAALASAYGIAVTTTMLITTLLFYRVTQARWGWSTRRALLVCAPLLGVDVMFFAANLPKIPTGGWFPLLVGFLLVITMTTWRRGRELVATRIRRAELPIGEVLGLQTLATTVRVPGTAVYLFKDAGAAPPALISNLEHNRVLHRETILLSIDTIDVPRVEDEDRIVVTRVGPGIHQAVVRCGFMETPNVPAALALARFDGDRIDPTTTTYFLGREAVRSTALPGMQRWRERMFAFMNRSAASASRFFELPADRVFEIGKHVDI
jgi:KUP system potassium uptake protein